MWTAKNIGILLGLFVVATILYKKNFLGLPSAAESLVSKVTG